MYRVGYAVYGPQNWQRRGQVVRLGSEGAWNSIQVRSPAPLVLGETTLLAYEGWDGGGAAGIGIEVSRERRIGARPPELEFLRTPGQASLAGIVRIENLGLGDLALESLALEGPAFAADLPQMPRQLGAGLSIPVGIEFTAAASGYYRGRLIAASDDPEQPVLEVDLRGSVARPITPCEVTGPALAMPSHLYRAGSPCFLDVAVCNAGGTLAPGTELLVVLEAGGHYFFGPSWVSSARGSDSYALDFPEGEWEIRVIPEFTWPAAVAPGGAVFWAALVDPSGESAASTPVSWEMRWD